MKPQLRDEGRRCSALSVPNTFKKGRSGNGAARLLLACSSLAPRLLKALYSNAPAKINEKISVTVGTRP
jgi:hypothetical protein